MRGHIPGFLIASCGLHPHFTERKLRPRLAPDLPQFTQLFGGRAETQTQTFLTLKLNLLEEGQVAQLIFQINPRVQIPLRQKEREAGDLTRELRPGVGAREGVPPVG